MAAPPEPPSSTPPAQRRTTHHAAVALSGHLDTRTAAMEVADELYDGIAGDCHLLLVFASFHHRAALDEAAEHLRRTLTPAVLLGSTADSVVGVDEEREGRAGLVGLALRLPGAVLRPWRISPQAPLDLDDAEAVRRRLAPPDPTAAVLMLCDPFSTPLHQALPALSGCRGSDGPLPIIGGVASGASQPGHNMLLLNDHAMPSGTVGVSIGGNVSIDCIVSQGCRPIGRPLVVTAAQQNVIQELGGQPPMAALKEITVELDDHDRELMNRGLMVGIVIDEYRERFGRGDFLIRSVMSLDTKRGAITVGDRVRVGQTIQFHLRDAATASEDLQLLLDAQQLAAPPFAAVLFTCNGRGRRLFEEPAHDVSTIHRRLGPVPVAGFFASGEIGPVGSQSFLHGHTACIGLFRAPSTA